MKIKEKFQKKSEQDRKELKLYRFRSVETTTGKELTNVDMDHDCSCCRDHFDQRHQKLQKVTENRQTQTKKATRKNGGEHVFLAYDH